MVEKNPVVCIVTSLCQPAEVTAKTCESGVSTIMQLSLLKEGQSAVIKRIGGNGALRQRILEMGLIKGAEIHVEKYAPLRDPLELVVKGYHVSLRVKEAEQITVEPIK